MGVVNRHRKAMGVTEKKGAGNAENAGKRCQVTS